MNRKPKNPLNTPHQQHKTISPMLNQNNIGNNAQNNPAPMYNPNIHPQANYHYQHPLPLPPFQLPYNYNDDIYYRLSKDMKANLLELKAEQTASPKDDNIAGVQEPVTNVSNPIVAPQQQEIIEQPIIVTNNQNVVINFIISELFLKQMIYGFSIKNRSHISLYIDMILFLTQLFLEITKLLIILEQQLSISLTLMKVIY
jgi:hypothetical protein